MRTLGAEVDISLASGSIRLPMIKVEICIRNAVEL